MPECRKCKSKIPSNIIIDGKQRNLQSRKYCLDCSPFGQHNTKVLGYEPKKKGTSENVKRWRHKMMQKAIEYKGGKCVVCGYDRCSRALDFHHINPNEKSFGISMRGLCRSWDRIKEELDKCVLVCSNCHREIEAGFTSLHQESN